MGDFAMKDFIILSGISGSGKSFLIQHAIQEYDWLCQIPSITTREQRVGVNESDSRIFLSEEDFDEEIKQENLIFINTIFGKRYAYRKTDIDYSVSCGKTILLDMKISTVSQVRTQFSNIFCIYIKVKSRNIKTELGLVRNNQDVRLKDALLEQESIERVSAYSKEIDLFFENNFDMDSVTRFQQLLSELR